jgi:hypothetical protein
MSAAARAAGLPIVAFALLCALLLAVPGSTVTTAYVNDLFIFLDGAHRVAAGQVPNRDFHTALGPLVYYVPAAGLLLSGSLAGAMPAAMALFTAALAPAIAYVLASRLRPLFALPLGVFLVLVLAVPTNLGEAVTSLSFAMFYNRVGWAALAALLVLYLPPRAAHPRRHVLDAAAAALLVLVLVYTKVSYALVGVAFLGFMLLDRGARRWVVIAALATAAAALAAELAWRGSLAHVEDVRLAARVSGTRGVIEHAGSFLRHLPDYALFGLLAGLALRRTRSPRDLLFFAFCAGAGLAIQVQNSQPWGIVTLHAGAAVAAQRLAGPGPAVAPALAVGTPLVLIALLLPTIVHNGMALGLHTVLAVAQPTERFGMPGFSGIKIGRVWSEAEVGYSRQYLETMQDGAQALASLGIPPERVTVTDFVSPFSAGLGLRPPRGDSSWLHWERNFDETNHVAPERLLGDALVVMEPKRGINAEAVWLVYGDFVEKNFAMVRETPFWRVHLRREARPHGVAGAR